MTYTKEFIALSKKDQVTFILSWLLSFFPENYWHLPVIRHIKQHSNYLIFFFLFFFFLFLQLIHREAKRIETLTILSGRNSKNYFKLKLSQMTN